MAYKASGRGGLEGVVCAWCGLPVQGLPCCGRDECLVAYRASQDALADLERLEIEVEWPEPVAAPSTSSVEVAGEVLDGTEWVVEGGELRPV